jgi:hypothetical protein
LHTGNAQLRSQHDDAAGEKADRPAGDDDSAVQAQ